MNDIIFLGVICITLALWVLRLQRKLRIVSGALHGAFLIAEEVADGKLEYVRGEDGSLIIQDTQTGEKHGE